MIDITDYSDKPIDFPNTPFSTTHAQRLCYDISRYVTKDT